MEKTIMYKNLEQRIFTTYLLQSPQEFSGCVEDGTDGEEWRSLYIWTRNAYKVFADMPELLVTQLHEDTTFPNTYIAEHNGRPKLKSEMRNAMKSINHLFYTVWYAACTGTVDGSDLILSSEYEIKKKYAALLDYLGIVISDGRMHANDYHGMFRALKQLSLRSDGFTPPWGKFAEGASVYANGYRRFVRCVYDEEADSLKDVFRRLSSNVEAFNELIKWLADNGYQYAVNFDVSEVRNMEGSGISFMKNIDHSIPDGGFYVYDHSHIGFRAEFHAIEDPPQKISPNNSKAERNIGFFQRVAANRAELHCNAPRKVWKLRLLHSEKQREKQAVYNLRHLQR